MVKIFLPSLHRASANVTGTNLQFVRTFELEILLRRYIDDIDVLFFFQPNVRFEEEK